MQRNEVQRGLARRRYARDVRAAAKDERISEPPALQLALTCPAHDLLEGQQPGRIYLRQLDQARRSLLRSARGRQRRRGRSALRLHNASRHSEPLMLRTSSSRLIVTGVLLNPPGVAEVAASRRPDLA
jgi:hypothetical protein